MVDAGPGFRTTALKINGAHAGVFQPFPKTGCEDEAELKLIAEEEVEDEASIIVLGEELWKPGETRAFIEAVVQFFPAPSLQPVEVVEASRAYSRAIDVVLVLDATGSMGPYLAAAQEALK